MNVQMHFDALSAISVDEIREAANLKKQNLTVPSSHPAYKLYNSIRFVGSKLATSDFAKLRGRNEIRSTIVHMGVPCLYVTISPSDVHNFLAFSFANEMFDLDDILASPHLTDQQFRSKLASSNPVGLAQFFYVIITAILHK
jgi:hypothetical protein